MFIVVFFLLLIVASKFKRGSMSLFLVAIYLISLLGNIFLTPSFELLDILHAFWVIFVLICIISPWSRYYGINEIYCSNTKRIDSLTKVFIIYFSIQTIGCAIISYFVISFVPDIEQFKYHENPNDFYYSLGLNMKPYLLAAYSCTWSYIMIPLHLYYISIRRYKMSIACFVASLASVAYGFTYFSRAQLLHYIFIYVAFYWLLRGTFPTKVRSFINKLLVTLSAVLVVLFISISIARFDTYDDEGRYNVEIENPVLASAFDYTCMWWSSSQDLFKQYHFQTMNGKIAMQQINDVINVFGLGYSNEAKLKLRESLLKEKKGAFIGVSAYFLYDFGFIISIIVLFIYYSLVKKIKPLKGVISIQKLLYVSAFIMLPLLGIFYSTLDTILFNLLLIIPAILYLKTPSYKKCGND